MSKLRTKTIIASAIFTALCLGSYQGSTVVGEKYSEQTSLITSQINDINGINITLVNRDKGFFSFNDSYQLTLDGMDGKVQLNTETSLLPWNTSGIIYIDKTASNHNLFEHLPSISETTLKWKEDHDATLFGVEQSVYSFKVETPDITIIDNSKLNEVFGINDITDGYLSLKGASINGQFVENNAHATLKVKELKVSASRASAGTIGFTITDLEASDRFTESEDPQTKQKASDYYGQLSLGQLAIEQDGGVIELKDAKLTTKGVSTDTVKAEQKLNIGNVAISANGIVISKPNIGYHWDVSGLNVNLDEESIASERYSDRLNETDRALVSTIEDGFSFNLHRLDLGVANGSMSVNTKPLADDVKGIDMPMIMQGVKVDADLNVSKSIVSLLPIPQEIIQAYQQQGFFTSDEENYIFKAKLEGQKLSVGDVDINATH